MMWCPLIDGLLRKKIPNPLIKFKGSGELVNSFLIKAFVFLLFSPTCFGVIVEDFGWSLEDLDRKYAHLSFEEAFKCGEKAEFQAAKFICKETCQNRGGFSICQSECVDPNIISESVTQEVVNCNSNSVTIFSSDGDIREITREQFLSFKKNPLRELISQMRSFRDQVYKVIILSSTPGKHTLGWKTSGERKVDGLYFRATIEAENPNEFAQAIFTVVNNSEIPWFAQAARIRVEREGTYWRLQDVK